MGLLNDKETIRSEVDSELYDKITEISELLEMGTEDFTEIALKRLVEEHERNGTVLIENAHVVSSVDEDGNDHPVTIHLNDLQHVILKKAASNYGASIKQAAKYGLFYFEYPLSPDKRNGQAMLDEIKLLRKPNAYFEGRYFKEIEELEAIPAEKAENQEN